MYRLNNEPLNDRRRIFKIEKGRIALRCSPSGLSSQMTHGNIRPSPQNPTRRSPSPSYTSAPAAACKSLPLSLQLCPLIGHRRAALAVFSRRTRPLSRGNRTSPLNIAGRGPLAPTPVTMGTFGLARAARSEKEQAAERQ